MVEPNSKAMGGVHTSPKAPAFEGWGALVDLERRVAFAEARASAAEEAAKFAVGAIESAHVAIAWISRILAAAGAGLAWWAAYYYFG